VSAAATRTVIERTEITENAVGKIVLHRKTSVQIAKMEVIDGFSGS
jgi:hypothetical protein